MIESAALLEPCVDDHNYCDARPASATRSRRCRFYPVQLAVAVPLCVIVALKGAQAPCCVADVPEGPLTNVRAAVLLILS